MTPGERGRHLTPVGVVAPVCRWCGVALLRHPTAAGCSRPVPVDPVDVTTAPAELAGGPELELAGSELELAGGPELESELAGGLEELPTRQSTPDTGVGTPDTGADTPDTELAGSSAADHGAGELPGQLLDELDEAAGEADEAAAGDPQMGTAAVDDRPADCVCRAPAGADCTCLTLDPKSGQRCTCRRCQSFIGAYYARIGRRHYDWPAIKARYVEGYPSGGETVWPSLNDVAAHFGVVGQRVREKAAQEGWRAQRTAWQQRLEEERRAKRVQAMTRGAEQLDDKALQAAQLGIQLCMQRLVEIGRAAQLRDAGSGVVVAGAVDAREMDALARATDLWHKIGLRSVGDVEAMRLEITGANGQPLDLRQELTRDDPSRLAGVIDVLARAGIDSGWIEGVVVDGDGAADGGRAALEAAR